MDIIQNVIVNSIAVDAVDASNEKCLLEKYQSGLERYPYCLKIQASSPDAHFIQFVTRQCLNLFEHNYENKPLQWDSTIGIQYMHDNTNPNWKLDVAAQEDIFYEEGGLSFKGIDFTAMYDQPGLGTDEERAIFCTFIIFDHGEIHYLMWSKQCDGNEYGNYTCNSPIKHDKNYLPCWAIRKIQQHLNLSSDKIPVKLLKILPEQPNFSDVDENQLKEEAAQYFLPPPNNWYTKINYPSLFTPQINLKESEKEKKGKPNI